MINYPPPITGQPQTHYGWKLRCLGSSYEATKGSRTLWAKTLIRLKVLVEDTEPGLT